MQQRMKGWEEGRPGGTEANGEGRFGSNGMEQVLSFPITAWLSMDLN